MKEFSKLAAEHSLQRCCTQYVQNYLPVEISQFTVKKCHHNTEMLIITLQLQKYKLNHSHFLLHVYCIVLISCYHTVDETCPGCLHCVRGTDLHMQTQLWRFPLQLCHPATTHPHFLYLYSPVSVLHHDILFRLSSKYWVLNHFCGYLAGII